MDTPKPDEEIAVVEKERVLFALNRNIDGVALSHHEQQRQVGGLEGIGQPLERVKIFDWLPIEFEHDIAWL